MLDSEARVLGYLDDLYVIIHANHIIAACDEVARAFQELGMAIKPEKTEVFCPDEEVLLPAAVAERGLRRVQKLSCLGSTLSFVSRGRDEEDDVWAKASRVGIHHEGPEEAH